MRREKRRGGPVLLAGLGGFALGAATVLLVVWVYGVRPAGAPIGAGAAGTAGAEGREGATAAPGGPGAPGVPGVRGSTGSLPPPRNGSTPGGSAPGPGAGGAVAAPGAAPPAAAPEGSAAGATRDSEAPPPPPAAASDIDALGRRHLLLPVQGLRREQLRDSFSEGRRGHLHEAIDIMAARNTPVMAVEDGRLAKLFVSAQGGNTLYQFDPSGTYAYYYAHLERYADGLHEGDQLRRGQVIGYVGTSGNAPPESPHLHFAIFRLTADKQWWKGTALDPYLVFTQP
jgi:peptidoglycan LD-endopeptidase LytH